MTLPMLQGPNGSGRIVQEWAAIEAECERLRSTNLRLAEEAQALRDRWASVPRGDIRTVLTSLFDFLPETPRETQDSWLRFANWLNYNAPEEGTNASR